MIKTLFQALALCLLINNCLGSTLDRRIQAYDCSNPQAIEDRALDTTSLACTGKAIAHNIERNVTYQLLVKETKRRLKGYKCTVYDSRQVSYCGKYSHQTNFHRFEYRDLPQPPSAGTCRKMVHERSMTTPNMEVLPLSLNRRLRYYWEEIGRTHEGSDFIYPAKQIQCTGEPWKVSGKNFENMVVDHHTTVLVTEEEFIWDGNYYVATSDNTRLPCGILDRDCQTGEATYFWDAAADYCPMGVSKTVSGMLATTEENKKVFMSTDGSLVRLVLQSQESFCDRMVWSTNYDALYLADADHRSPFTRKLDPISVSMTTFVSNRDDFLYNYLVRQINTELTAVLQHDCEEHRRHTRMDFYTKHSNPGAITYGFGNGTFASSAGEVLYYYQCRPEVVQALQLEECFDALPVSLPTSSPLPGLFNATQWYVEPLTKRLTRYASIVPCTKNFSPKYQAWNNRWIIADPVLHFADPPKPMAAPATVMVHLKSEQDFSKGGLYSAEDLKAWEAFAFIGRIREAVTSQLAESVSNNYQHSSGDLVFQDPDSWFKSKFKGFLHFIDGYGHVCSILIGLFWTFKLVGLLIGWLYGGRQVFEEVQSCLPSVLWAFCPAMYLLKRQGQRAKAERAERTPAAGTFQRVPEDPIDDHSHRRRSSGSMHKKPITQSMLSLFRQERRSHRHQEEDDQELHYLQPREPHDGEEVPIYHPPPPSRQFANTSPAPLYPHPEEEGTTAMEEAVAAAQRAQQRLQQLRDNQTKRGQE